MAEAAQEETAAADVLVMSAAVADFTPAATRADKIERADKQTLKLDLVRTTDVLMSCARPGLVRVAFAAEAGPQLARARAKRRAKGCELLVYNDILAAGIGIGADENEITIISEHGERHVPRAAKTVCAQAIVDEIAPFLPPRE
jgi:phosphopantothenoylcysteine decarboxylase/phosphopantothenate--cysteine ligase